MRFQFWLQSLEFGPFEFLNSIQFIILAYYLTRFYNKLILIQALIYNALDHQSRLLLVFHKYSTHKISRVQQKFTICISINIYTIIKFSFKMRYIMKGGVWKNSEDQILKAAIMKYGLNQWSRISSLLPRKSAKQCKQRWYEWLDPSIKKTEWTRDEDEKLLQLARVFPSQWRTVAPFVGRTPAQCYERYEKLLDLAQGKDPNDTQDLRKLRPRQIDPNPQTKPARPDPIDMDEDQKQMLAEVRVRLANTKGKKAKRKEREKYIDEARRLARLQKARQLTMAGVQNIVTQQQLKRMRQRRDINYNKQVPFKRDAPDFVFKTQHAENPNGNVFALNMSLQALQGKRRDVEEQNARKEDKRRIKKLQERDPTTLINPKMYLKPQPTPISLSDPQLNDKDLEQLKKMNLTTPLNTLIHQNSNTPSLMTPHNRLMFEARVNHSLNSVGPGQLAQDDMDGVEGLMILKNLKKEESQRISRGQGLTPSLASRINTPLNTWDFENNSSKLKSLFQGLSKPQNLIQFQIPEQQQQDQKQNVMDAQEQQKIQLQRQNERLRIKLEQRSNVLKKNLPRIKNIPSSIQLSCDIDNLVSKEYISLVYSDAVDYPVEGIELPTEQIQYKELIQDHFLDDAKKLISLQMPDKIQDLHQKIQKIRLFVTYNIKTKKSIYNQKVQASLMPQYLLDLPNYKQLLKRSEGLQKKTNKFLGGYEGLIVKNTQQLNALIQEYEDTVMKKQSLMRLRNQQQQGIVSQLQQLKNYYQMIYKSV